MLIKIYNCMVTARQRTRLRLPIMYTDLLSALGQHGRSMISEELWFNSRQGQESFTLLRNIQIESEAHPASYSQWPQRILPRVNAKRRKADHSHTHSICVRGVHWDTFTSTNTLLLSYLKNVSRVTDQTVSRRLPITETRIRYQISPREIRGGQGGIGAGFSPSTEICPC